ncbi:MAG TPA: amidase family protein, partial [Thermomicrobiales bacterium]|nr:amidase family protein [Thermomicrobiales bacterium]
MNPADICFMPALELREHYRTGSLSPVEVTETVLARIDAVNPTLNAFITVTPERAMDDARRAEDAYRSGDAGPLEGIPTSIKDLVPTRGIRTTSGSLLHKNRVPDEDAPL